MERVQNNSTLLFPSFSSTGWPTDTCRRLPTLKRARDPADDCGMQHQQQPRSVFKRPRVAASQPSVAAVGSLPSPSDAAAAAAAAATTATKPIRTDNDTWPRDLGFKWSQQQPWADFLSLIPLDGNPAPVQQLVDNFNREGPDVPVVTVREAMVLAERAVTRARRDWEHEAGVHLAQMRAEMEHRYQRLLDTQFGLGGRPNHQASYIS